MSSPRTGGGLSASALEAGAAVSSSTVATRRRPGSWARSRRARVSTSEKVTSTSAPAVWRMPAWRRRWSSIWLLRAGG